MQESSRKHIAAGLSCGVISGNIVCSRYPVQVLNHVVQSTNHCYLDNYYKIRVNVKYYLKCVMFGLAWGCCCCYALLIISQFSTLFLLHMLSSFIVIS